MPPRPLHPSEYKLGFHTQRDQFSQRPLIAQGIARCISNWSHVEAELGTLFVAWLGANENTGAQMYNGLESSRAKIAALKSIAITRMTRKHFALFLLLLKIVRAKQKTRDKIAHWQWYLAEDIQDAMIVSDPKRSILQTSRNMPYIRHNMWPDDSTIDIKGDYQVYTADSLEKDADEFQELYGLIGQSRGIGLPHWPLESRDVLYNELTTHALLVPWLSQLQLPDQ